jgi:predicted ATP-dependent endonuclease of OLD family
MSRVSVFISEIRIENFRLFGAGVEAFVLGLKPGLTALVGENGRGKTAVIDAIRLILEITDRGYYRVDPADFHRNPANGSIEQYHDKVCAAFGEWLQSRSDEYLGLLGIRVSRDDMKCMLQRGFA